MHFRQVFSNTWCIPAIADRYLCQLLNCNKVNKGELNNSATWMIQLTYVRMVSLQEIPFGLTSPHSISSNNAVDGWNTAYKQTQFSMSVGANFLPSILSQAHWPSPFSREHVSMIIYTFQGYQHLFSKKTCFGWGPKELQTNLLPRKQETVISVVVGFNSFEKNWSSNGNLFSMCQCLKKDKRHLHSLKLT